MTWPTTPTRFVLTEVDERGPRDGEDGELLSVSEYRGVIPRRDSASQQAASEDVSHYKRCEPGQLVLNRLWAFRGGLGVSAHTGLVSPDYAVYDINPQMDPRFVHYQTRSSWFVAEMTKRLRGIGNPDASNGRAPRINTSDLGHIDMYTPPVEVQRRVADVLDHEISRIDSLIAKNEQVLTVLAARVDRLMLDALNNDLLSRAPLGYFAHVNMGQSPPSTEVTPISEASAELPFLQGNAEFGATHPEPQLVCGKATKRAARGDILLSVRAPVGAMNLADRTLGIGRGLCAITPESESLDSRFAWWAIREARSRLDAVATGSTYHAVSATDVRGVEIAIAPLSEQRAIAAALDNHEQRSWELRQAVRSQIDLLESRRRSLVTGAVTGQIEV